MKKTIIGILIISMLCICTVGCTQKEISDGEIFATIVWSSPFYEYMIVDDTKYSPIQTEGNSTFKIPIVLDKKINVSPSTVAMSQPYLIDYTLFFYSKTLKGE